MTANTQRNLIIILLIVVCWLLAGTPSRDDMRRAWFRTQGKPKKREHEDDNRHAEAV